MAAWDGARPASWPGAHAVNAETCHIPRGRHSGTGSHSQMGHTQSELDASALAGTIGRCRSNRKAN
jgi:hypothetical protein